jgi:hypothetical protein
MVSKRIIEVGHIECSSEGGKNMLFKGLSLAHIEPCGF